MRLAYAANESQFYSSRFGQSRLNRFYQPKARYKNRPDSKLGSVRLEIAARLKAYFRLETPWLGSTWLEQDIAGRDSGHLTRLDSARLSSAGYSDSTHLRSWLRLSLGLGSGLGNQLDARLGSARSLARAQLGVKSEIGSGLVTRDSVWLGSEESELSSAHLDRSIARPIWARFISVRKLL